MIFVGLLLPRIWNGSMTFLVTKVHNGLFLGLQTVISKGMLTVVSVFFPKFVIAIKLVMVCNDLV